MRDLEQIRAAYAWEKVAKVAQEDYSKDYENLAKAAPALVINNGLMQTLAFFEGKGKNHHKKLNQHLFTWLAQRFKGVDRFPPENDIDYKKIMEALHQSSSLVYRQATEEALALLRWLRQFAAAYETE